MTDVAKSGSALHGRATDAAPIRLHDLPTPAQINALTDVPSLRRLCDDVERQVLQIEAQLEFQVIDDEAWATRASNALAAFRFAERALKRRLNKLTQPGAPGAPGAQRPPEDISPLTLEVLGAAPVIDVASLNTVAEVDEKLAWLVERINAVCADRDDEVAQVAIDRDEGFIAAANTARRAMSVTRMALQNRRGEISKAAKAGALAERDRRREQMFVDAARTMLPKDVYTRLWDRVDRAEIEDALAPSED